MKQVFHEKIFWLMKKRLIKYLEAKGISKYRFYEDTGLSNGYLDKAGGLNGSSIEKISALYQDLNIEWVISGAGDMLRSGSSNPLATPGVAPTESDGGKSHERVIDRFDKLLEAKGMNDHQATKFFGFAIGTIGKSRAQGRDLSSKNSQIVLNLLQDVSPSWLLAGEGPMFKTAAEPSPSTVEMPDQDEQAHLVPLLPVVAYGGAMSGFDTDGVMLSDCERIVSPLRNAELAIPVVGDSMAPEYPNGSRVLVRKINDKAFIEWGAPYVLDTCNGAILKIVAPADRDDYLRCISLNRAPEYAPFDVYRDDIRGMYRVLMCMALK